MTEAEYAKKGEQKNIFVLVGNKPNYLICNNTASGLKEYIIKWHYVTIHAAAYDKYKDQFRRGKVAQFKKILTGQQS